MISRKILYVPAGGADNIEDPAMQPENHALSPAEKLMAGLLLTDVDLAELLDVSLQTTRNWRWRGQGPRYVKVGARMVRYHPADVIAFIDGRVSAP